MSTILECDCCGDTAPVARVATVWVRDGGDQIDPPSGRTEDTGDNKDICMPCRLTHAIKALRTAKVGDDAGDVFDRITCEAVGMRWRGE